MRKKRKNGQKIEELKLEQFYERNISTIDFRKHFESSFPKKNPYECFILNVLSPPSKSYKSLKCEHNIGCIVNGYSKCETPARFYACIVWQYQFVWQNSMLNWCHTGNCSMENVNQYTNT